MKFKLNQRDDRRLGEPQACDHDLRLQLSSKVLLFEQLVADGQQLFSRVEALLAELRQDCQKAA
jgi:hypothetical protein